MSSVSLYFCVCVIRREIQRLQDEREELLRSLRVSQSCFNRWTDASGVQDLTSMLAHGDRIDKELEAEKAKVASLKDQVKSVFPWTIYRMPHIEFLLIFLPQLTLLVCFVFRFWNGRGNWQNRGLRGELHAAVWNLKRKTYWKPPPS